MHYFCVCLNIFLLLHIMLLPHQFIMQEALQSSGAMVNYCYDVDEELWCQFTLRVSFVLYKPLPGYLVSA